MDKSETAHNLAKGLLRLNETTSLKTISITDIVANCKRNRKTFYYHFESKEQLIRWIYRNDIALKLESEFHQTELITKANDESPMKGLPFYGQRIVGIRSIDSTDFINCFIETITKRKKFYHEALLDSSETGLSAYIASLMQEALRADIYFMLGNRYLAKNDIGFLSEFYAGAIVKMAQNIASRNTTENPFAAMNLTNIVHASIEHAINDEQRKREHLSHINQMHI